MADLIGVGGNNIQSNIHFSISEIYETHPNHKVALVAIITIINDNVLLHYSFMVS
jgi:hypothetical protein